MTDNTDKINKILEHFSVFVNKPDEFKSFTNLNIVLDLDETLVHTYENYDFKEDLTSTEVNYLKSRLFEYRVVDPNTSIEESTYRIYGIMRPWLKQFLIFCFVYFRNVIVWSAGQPRYVMKIVDILFRDIFPPLIIYTKDQTDIDDDNTTYKPLEKLFNDSRLVSCNVNKKNTLIIDDKYETFSKNKLNGICIPAYEPGISFAELSTNDPSFIQLILWLQRDSIMKAGDVRVLDKSNIFKEPYHIESLQKCRMINGKLHCLTSEVMNVMRKIKTNQL